MALVTAVTDGMPAPEGILGADQAAKAGLDKAKEALAETQAQLRRARAHATRAEDYTLAELDVAQREDEEMLVAICCRMRQRDEARRLLSSEKSPNQRSVARVGLGGGMGSGHRQQPPPQQGPLAAAAAAQRLDGAGRRMGDASGDWSLFPAATALLLGLVTAVAGEGEIGLDSTAGDHGWSQSYRTAIAAALRMVEAEVTERCQRVAQGVKHDSGLRCAPPSTTVDVVRELGAVGCAALSQLDVPAPPMPTVDADGGPARAARRSVRAGAGGWLGLRAARVSCRQRARRLGGCSGSWPRLGSTSRASSTRM
jgi:hypothetical protein